MPTPRPSDTLAHPTRRPAIVTGASSGIGLAAAVHLASLGHPVVLGARRTDICEAAAQKITDAGGEAIAVPLDVTDARSVEEFTAAAEAAVGPVEILVSSAGDVLPSSTIGTDPETFRHQMEVNLLGVHRLVTLVVPAMVERQRGDVVFISSDVVSRPRPNMSSYVTAKWGLEGLIHAMRMEMEGTGVRVSTVRPGPTVTGMGAGWDLEVVAPLLEEWNRWGLMRHDGYLSADGVAAAVAAIVTAPRGTHLAAIDVLPEAPVRPRSNEPVDRARETGAN